MAVLLAIAVYMMRMYGFDSRLILVGSILISLVALACLGRPFAFAYCLLALMVSYDKRGVLRTSLEGGRTRSYFGIYEVYVRPGGTARLLTHGTTLHGIQNLDPALEREPTSYYARRSGIGIALTNADSLFSRLSRGEGTLGMLSRDSTLYREATLTVVQLRTLLADIQANPRRYFRYSVF
jgi:hypothetical protein